MILRETHFATLRKMDLLSLLEQRKQAQSVGDASTVVRMEQLIAAKGFQVQRKRQEESDSN